MRAGGLFLSGGEAEGEGEGDCLEGRLSGGCDGVGGGSLLFLGFLPLAKIVRVRLAVLGLTP